MLPPSGYKLLLQPAFVEQCGHLGARSPTLLKQNVSEEPGLASNILIGGVTPCLMFRYVDILTEEYSFA